MHMMAIPAAAIAASADSSANANPQCTDVERFLRILHLDGVFEVRSPNCPERLGGNFRSTASGYFSDAEAAAAAVRKLEQRKPPAIYVTVNPTNPSLLARANNRIEAKPKSTTSDPDITRRRWLFVDIDATRPAGVSATDAELAAAMAVADAIHSEMLSTGWPEPLRGMSGNGAYLFWRLDLPSDEASSALVKGVLHSLADRFNTEAAEVDTTTFNASRICKVLGTTARKGDPLVGIPGVEDRPHRRAWFIEPDGELEIVTEAMLRDLAATHIAEATASPLMGTAARARGSEPSLRGEPKAHDYDPDDVATAAKCLRHMAADLADDRETWIKIGIAAKTVSDRLWSDWDAFSQLSAKYTPNDAQKTWASLKPRGGCGLGTLIHYARESGMPFESDYDPDPLADMAAQSAVIAADGYGMPPAAAMAAEPSPAEGASDQDAKLLGCELILVDSDPVVFRFRCTTVSEKYCELADWAPSLPVMKREFLKQTHRPLPMAVCRRWKTLPDRLALPEVLQVQRPDPAEDINCAIAAEVLRILRSTYSKDITSLADASADVIADLSAFAAVLRVNGVRYVQFDRLYSRISDESRLNELTRKRLSRVLKMAGGESEIERLGKGAEASRRRLWRLAPKALAKLDEIANGEH